MDFVQRATAEVKMRPAVDVIFGMDFLGKSAVSSGCLRCPGSVWNAAGKGGFLEEVKSRCEEVIRRGERVDIHDVKA